VSAVNPSATNSRRQGVCTRGTDKAHMAVAVQYASGAGLRPVLTFPRLFKSSRPAPTYGSELSV
jgi:hypothetical protein